MQGIYKLVFEGLKDWPYIGQSLDIIHRYDSHINSLKKGTSNFKLQEAYEMCGEPKLEIIEETSDLNEREIYWINYYDSIENGLNITAGGDSSGNGYQHARSKYTREQILQVFNLLCNTTNTLLSISEETGVSINQVSGIKMGRTHLWLRDEFPTEWEKLINSENRRASRKETKTISHPVLGEISLKEAQDHFEDVNTRSGINSVLKGESKSYNGWTLKGNEYSTYPELLSPEGEVFSLKEREVSAFAKKHNLHRTSLLRVLQGKQNTTKGWRLSKPKTKMGKNTYPHPPITDGTSIYFIKYRGINSFALQHNICQSALNLLLQNRASTTGPFELANDIQLNSLKHIYQE